MVEWLWQREGNPIIPTKCENALYWSFKGTNPRMLPSAWLRDFPRVLRLNIHQLAFYPSMWRHSKSTNRAGPALGKHSFDKSVQSLLKVVGNVVLKFPPPLLDDIRRQQGSKAWREVFAWKSSSMLERVHTISMATKIRVPQRLCNAREAYDGEGDSTYGALTSRLWWKRHGSFYQFVMVGLAKAQCSMWVCKFIGTWRCKQHTHEERRDEVYQH